MDKVIENGQIVEDNYTLVADKETLDPKYIDDANAILPWGLYQRIKDQRPATGNAVWLDSDELPDAIQDDLSSFSLIAINFPAFTDGRGYSFAYRLRHSFGYQGKLRAVGDVLIDQLSAFKRVGFDSFALRDDQDAEEALKHFSDFKDPYQASIEPSAPLFRKL
ncbi:MAG: DUF934 domain-containing protein [Cellvibrionales bacterium]|nr:DUF934 domain-containing protein [Cellvibrionales bacterium]